MRNAFYEDIKYIYEKLLLHPLFLIDATKKIEFETLFNSLCLQVVSYDDFVASINRLTGFFCDGHTNMEMPYFHGDNTLNISCYWCNGKLLLKSDYMGVHKDSEIIGIEDKTIDEIVSLMENNISHENIFLVKSRMINYPYKNYHVFSEGSLKYLFGFKDKYRFEFISNGLRTERTFELEPYNGYLDFLDDDFVYYEIIRDIAVLHLDSCICNETYKRVLGELVDECYNRKVKILVLDLSKNMGGSSAVIDEFIKHINVEEYRRYEMIDYSSGKAKYITQRAEIVRNSPYSKCMDVEIHCKVSHDTFSSARTFAVTLKDNGIAKSIIGMPTGGKPSSFGMPQRFKTPNLSIPFRVSRCLFLRPNKAGDDAVSLFPDKVCV